MEPLRFLEARKGKMRRINYKQTAPNRIKSQLLFQKVPLAAPLLHISKNHRKGGISPWDPDLVWVEWGACQDVAGRCWAPMPRYWLQVFSWSALSSLGRFLFLCSLWVSSIKHSFLILNGEQSIFWDKALGGALRTQKWMRSILALPTPVAKSRVPNSTECSARGPVPGCGCLWELVWGWFCDL